MVCRGLVALLLHLRGWFAAARGVVFLWQQYRLRWTGTSNHSNVLVHRSLQLESGWLVFLQQSVWERDADEKRVLPQRQCTGLSWHRASTTAVLLHHHRLPVADIRMGHLQQLL